ncbi:MAG: hypothetical protein HN341_05310 [Verrucomicrobia bacterium]|jgi:uncharacterized alkaline shock family protein YloU|nr:hypothetical protein [Verrucomicrobiota bacterium]
MKMLHRIVFLFVFALLTATGIGLMCTAAVGENWAVLEALLPGSRVTGACIGVILFGLASLLFLTGLDTRRRDRFLSFSNEQGAVNISTDAIADYVSKLAPEFPSIVKMTPLVMPQRRRIDIVVDVRIKAGPQLHEICEVLQRRVRESMEKGLGISEVRRVIVSVKQISSEHKSS